MVVARDLDEPPLRNRLGKPAAHADRNHRIAGPVQEQRRGLDGRRDCAHVVLPEDRPELAKAVLGGDEALEPRPPSLVALVPVSRGLETEVLARPEIVRVRAEELVRLLGRAAVWLVVASHRPDGCGVEHERTYRSGYVAAKSIVIAPPRAAPKRAAVSLPAASMTERMSSICSSRYGISGPRSDSPMPRMSKTMSRENDASRSAYRDQWTSSHMTSRFEKIPFV